MEVQKLSNMEISGQKRSGTYYDQAQSLLEYADVFVLIQNTAQLKIFEMMTCAVCVGDLEKSGRKIQKSENTLFLR